MTWINVAYAENYVKPGSEGRVHTNRIEVGLLTSITEGICFMWLFIY